MQHCTFRDKAIQLVQRTKGVRIVPRNKEEDEVAAHLLNCPHCREACHQAHAAKPKQRTKLRRYAW